MNRSFKSNMQAIKPTLGKIESLQRENLNWRRIMSAIGRSNHMYPSVDRGKLSVVESQLKKLSEITGFWSLGRKSMTNIGEALLQSSGKGLRIVCPVCVDHQQVVDDGKRVPKLIPQHITFLESIREVLPITSVTFLFATYGKTQPAEVKEYVRQACRTTQETLSDPFYSAVEIGEYLPNIRAEEERIKIEVSSQTDYFEPLMRRLAPERKTHYVRLGMEQKIWQRRTRESIVEFLALGRHASTNGILICSHTTGRIRCFLKAGAGVLHNPIGFQ